MCLRYVFYNVGKENDGGGGDPVAMGLSELQVWRLRIRATTAVQSAAQSLTIRASRFDKGDRS